LLGLVGEESGVALGSVEGGGLVGEVAYQDGEVVGAGAAGVEVAPVDAHGAGGVAVGVVGEAPELSYLLEAGLAVLCRAPVVEEEVSRRVVGDEEVCAAVAVDVDRGHGQGLGHGLFGARVGDVEAGLAGDLGEGAVAIVEEEEGVGPAVGLGEAVGEDLAAVDGGDGALGDLGGIAVDLGRPLEVVADEEVEVAVAVGVEEGGAGAPGSHLGGLAGDACLLGHVLEVAPAVAEEAVGAYGGEVEVDPAVAVVVGGGHAHAVEGGEGVLGVGADGGGEA
jgi:hypothetical protein